MNTASPAPGREPLEQGFQLGELSIDPRAGEVTGPGGREKLDPKVMDVLVMLAQSAGQVVLREDLLARIWPNTIVTDDALSRCIYELRRQLTLAGGDERYRAMLETVPKRGYRLNGEITLPSPAVVAPTLAAGAAPPVANPPASERRRRRHVPAIVAGAAILLVLLAALGRQLATPGARSAPQPSGQSSVAVLPFVDMSAAQDQAYLADGIAEDVRSRLAQSKDLRVISRSSSFLFRERPADVRDIADKLDVTHVLEGSVRRSGDRLRITAQLIAATDSSHVWSMRFDRTAGDIFAIQDEISVQVTRALEVSLSPGAMERMRRRGTTNLEAYLEFLQGHALLATHRVNDAKGALARFQQAVALDPRFATGYLGVAEAALFAAEFEITDDRQRRFDTARRRGELLVERALAIDPEHGDAYLQRAHLAAYENLASAERDFRRGLELSPNSAEGYAGLAEVLYASLPRRDEALELLDRARKLDPLEPAYDVRKAVYLYDERSDPEAARELLVDVVARYPRYAPAVARLCESNFLVGDIAEAIGYCEEALALDPLLEESRRFLIHQYLLLGRPDTAGLLVGAAGEEPTLRSIPILIDRRDWVRAGEVAYRALETRTTSPSARWYACSAIRMHARTTGDYARAVAALEAESGITWNANGNPLVPDQPTGVRDPAIALADVLIQSGQDGRGRRLLEAILARMRHETGELGRPEYWYVHFHPAALAMNGEGDAAIAMLERSMAQRAKPVIAWWQLFEIEPAFAPLRADPRFEAFSAKVRAHIAAERDELERLRAEGRLPERSTGQQSGGSPSVPAMQTTVASGNLG